MSINKFEKHMRSKFKRWVITDPQSDEIVLETNDIEELNAYNQTVRDKKLKYLQARILKIEETEVVPKYDPFTGEPL